MIKFSFQSLLVVLTFSLGTNTNFAQDILVNSLKVNASDKSKESFKFTDVINLANTSVKNQGSSGTCWSYSGNSFLESEMIRIGKQPVELSQIFSARNAYVEKGKNYVRMHGAVTLGDGGSLHDVTNMLKKYGAVPQEVYTGLNYGTAKNKFAEIAALTSATENFAFPTGIGSCQIKSSAGTSGPRYLTFGPRSRCVNLNQARANASSRSAGFSWYFLEISR